MHPSTQLALAPPKSVAGGLVDDRYLKAVPGSSLLVGQRVAVTNTDARRSIEQGRLLRAAITALSA